MRLDNRGFSLLGLNLLMGIFVSILAVALFIINPARQNALEDNSRRKSDLLLIANAAGQYIYEMNGRLPEKLTFTPLEISGADVDLCTVLLPGYLTTLPADPVTGSPGISHPCPAAYTTGYFIVRNKDNTFTVSAPASGEQLSVTRTIRSKQ